MNSNALDELRAWVSENMPALHSELGPLPLGQCRQRLNEVTGLSIPMYSPIHSAAPQFLAALKAQHEQAGKQQLVQSEPAI